MASRSLSPIAHPVAVAITHHAIDRYRQRVADLPERSIRRVLAGRTVQLAVAIGGPFVRLPTGQRVVLQGDVVVTVLPVDQELHLLSTAADRRRKERA